MDDESELDEEHEKNVTANHSDPNNPWVNEIKADEEVQSFVKGYKKFWEQQNKQKEIAANHEVLEEVEENKREVEQNNNEISKKIIKTPKRKNENVSKNNKKKKAITSTEWKVTSIDDDTALENIFDDLEHEIVKNVRKKAQNITSNDQKKIKSPKPMKEKKAKKSDLSIPKRVTRPIINEELLENTTDATEEISTPASKELEVLQNILNATSEPQAKTKNINPHKIMNVKPVALNTELPELLTMEEDEGDDSNMAGIAEAFEDDDVVEEFNNEKAEEIEKSKPKNIDLSLPGWGSWGGKDLKTPKKKRRKFIINFPKKPKRKDMNKGRVIINEDGNEKARPHMVSEIPFPFKTVKDFEASIRAPIGNTFIPEVPHRRMIKPAVRTKMGTIIEPMSEEILMKKVLRGLPIVK